MKSLKEIISKSIDSDFKTEVLYHAIEEWIIDEFSPQIEKWVKDYVMDNHTELHIEDFCADDSVTTKNQKKNEKD